MQDEISDTSSANRLHAEGVPARHSRPSASAGAHTRWLPIFAGVLPIRTKLVPSDIVSGVTLAALAIPEVMGHTKIAETPVITGLYTILLPMALFAVFGSSRHLVVGADSATAAIIAGGLGGMASPGSGQWLALAELLALMAAAMLGLARILRLGFLADFLSRTVLIGFLTGVGVQVALGEIAGMLGLPGGGHGVIARVLADAREIGQFNPYAFAVALAVIAIILGGWQVSKKVPGALIAVVAAIIASWALDLKAEGVPVLGAVPSGLPHLGLPNVAWSWSLLERLVPTALAIAIVILAQSAATSRAYASRYNERLNENTDLVGLALANAGAGFSGTFVVNGSPTKTQMVDSAGGHSQLAQLTTAAIVLIVLWLLTGPLSYMPEAVLAAVVFLIGIELIDIRGMRTILAERPWEFWIALITAVVVVVVGVEQGILMAMALSLLDHTRRGYRPHNVVLVPDRPEGWRTRPVGEPAQLRPGLMVYRFNHSMYYANAGLFSEQATALAKEAQPPLRCFCLDAAAINDVDFSAAATLRTVYSALKQQGIRFAVVELSDQLRAEFERYGLPKLFGEDAFYKSIGELVAGYQSPASLRSAPDRGGTAP
jgi:sulfate permease, SulP family